MDGMGLLRGILIDCFRILKSQSSSSSLLMVTELPNVEDSCELLKSMLDTSITDKYRIRVAYIEDDVESVDEYAREREIESGLHVNTRDWSTSSGGVYNRALALVSISREKRGEGTAQIASYQGAINRSNSSSQDYISDETDCEDYFLTKEGIKFSRNFLLL